MRRHPAGVKPDRAAGSWDPHLTSAPGPPYSPPHVRSRAAQASMAARPAPGLPGPIPVSAPGHRSHYSGLGRPPCVCLRLCSRPHLHSHNLLLSDRDLLWRPSLICILPLYVCRLSFICLSHVSRSAVELKLTLSLRLSIQCSFHSRHLFSHPQTYTVIIHSNNKIVMRIKEVTTDKGLKWCLAHSRCSINVSCY